MNRFVILLCWLMPLLVSAQEKSTIQFSSAKNWNELLAEARTSNKPIFIDAFTTWCGPCKKMDQEVFTDKDVADYMNKNLLSIRIQMDSSKNDNEFIKNWRKETNLWKTYVTAYPCFLFFTPEGKFTGRELGYYESQAFLELLRKNIDSENNYSTKIEKFQNGALNKSQMLSLAFTAQSLKDTVALAVAREYKRRYIERAPVDSLLNPQFGKFIGEFYEVFKSQDKIIRWMNKCPELTDSLFLQKKYAGPISDLVISRDYIYKVILPNDVPINSSPEWNKIQKHITADFDSNTAKRLVINAKVFWAYKHEDFKEAASLELKKIDMLGMDTTAMGRIFFNNTVYNIIFKYADDISVLKKAAALMKYVTELDKHNSTNHLDTYASVLYKAGDKQRALQIENIALELAKKKKDEKNIRFYTNMIERMTKDEKTWKLKLD